MTGRLINREGWTFRPEYTNAAVNTGSAVIFKICGNDLIDHLHEVVRIRMYSEGCVIIGPKKLLYKLYQANPGCELLDEEKAAIGGKITAVEIYFNLPIASIEMVFRIVIEDLFSWFDYGFVHLYFTKNQVLFLFTFQVKAVKPVTTVTSRLSAAFTASR